MVRLVRLRLCFQCSGGNQTEGGCGGRWEVGGDSDRDWSLQV